jgi:hypothetical protein
MGDKKIKIKSNNAKGKIIIRDNSTITLTATDGSMKTATISIADAPPGGVPDVKSLSAMDFVYSNGGQILTITIAE